MRSKYRYLTHAALIAALYVVLTYLQNFLIPDSATWVIQFRAAEALSVLSFYTSAAIPGLSIGCLLFNLSYVGALPLDFLVGTLATALACGGMYLTRRITFWGVPVVGLLLPAVSNGLLVGWELAQFVGGGFFLNAFYVALGEAAVLMTLGLVLHLTMTRRGIAARLFG